MNGDRKMKKLLIGLVFLFFALPLYATVYEIGIGEEYETLASLQSAVTLQPGDVVDGRDNIFLEEFVLGVSGTVGNPIVIQNCVIDGEDLRNYGVKGQNISHIIIKDLIVRNVIMYGIAIEAVIDTYWEIYSNEVYNCGIGINVTGNFNKVYDNFIHDTVMILNDETPNNDYGATGFLINGEDNEFYNNMILDCIKPSIDYGFDGSCFEIWSKGNRTNIHDNFCGYSNIFIEGNATELCDVVLKDNTSWKNRLGFLFIHSDISDLQRLLVEDNIFDVPQMITIRSDGKIIINHNGEI